MSFKLFLTTFNINNIYISIALLIKSKLWNIIMQNILYYVFFKYLILKKNENNQYFFKTKL